MRFSRYILPAALLCGGLLIGCATNGGSSTAGIDSSTGGTSSLSPTAFSAGPGQVVLDELKIHTKSDVGGAGWKVASSDDGSVVLVTTPYLTIKDKTSGKIRGSIGFAKLYRNGSNKSEPSFTGSKTVNLLFGAAAGISGDGKVVAVGAPGAGVNDQGRLFCFASGPKGWGTAEVYPATFSAAGPTGSFWGLSVALNEDGSTIVFGAPGEKGHGMVHYFLAPKSGWTASSLANGVPGGFLGAGSPQAGDEFGSSVAISRDDSVIAVGAPGRDNGKGAVYLFVKPKAGWTAVEEVIPVTLSNGVAGDRFGESVAVSDDGTTIAVGADGEKKGSGDVYFVRFDKSTRKITMSSTGSGNDTSERFGISVSISGDGRTLAAGGFSDKDHTGEVVVLRSASGNWNDMKLVGRYAASNPVPPDQQEAFLGFSVALNRSGTQVVAGAPGYNRGVGDFATFDLTK